MSLQQTESILGKSHIQSNSNLIEQYASMPPFIGVAIIASSYPDNRWHQEPSRDVGRCGSQTFAGTPSGPPFFLVLIDITEFWLSQFWGGECTLCIELLFLARRVFPLY